LLHVISPVSLGLDPHEHALFPAGAKSENDLSASRTIAKRRGQAQIPRRLKGSTPVNRYLQIAAAVGLASSLSACTSPALLADAASASNTNTCIYSNQIKKRKILGDQDIQFEMSNGDIWVNHLAHRCSGLRSDQGFSWDLHGMTVCSNQQTIYLLEDGTACQLGEFKKQPTAET
jgi:hypothetical protein